MKPSATLKQQPFFVPEKKSPEAPVKTVVDKLSVIEGKQLDIMTRSNPAMAKAKEMSYIYEFLYDSKFVKGYLEMIELMAISAAGQARGEMITSLEAGGHLPPEYYSGRSKGGRSDLLYARDDDDD